MIKHARRSFIAVLVCLIPTSLWALEDPKENISSETFAITVKGKDVGTYKIDKIQKGDTLEVVTQVDSEYKIGPIKLFDFEQISREIWQEGKLLSLVSQTRSGGKTKDVVVARKDDDLHVKSDAFTGILPENTLPSTYWNRNLTKVENMLSTADGNIVPITVTPLDVSETSDDKDRYHIVGDTDFTMEFLGEQLVGLQMKVRGRIIEYTLQ